MVLPVVVREQRGDRAPAGRQLLRRAQRVSEALLDSEALSTDVVWCYSQSSCVNSVVFERPLDASSAACATVYWSNWKGV